MIQSYFSIVMYVGVIIVVIISFIKNKEKTLLALRKALKMFIAILPQFITVLLIMGAILAISNQSTIETLIGSNSGILGVVVSAIVGSIALIPVLIAFPVAVELLNNGVGLVQIAVFISALTTVGFITIPLETRFLGRKIALVRNALFFIASFIVAGVVRIILL